MVEAVAAGGVHGVPDDDGRPLPAHLLARLQTNTPTQPLFRTAKGGQRTRRLISEAVLRASEQAPYWRLHMSVTTSRMRTLSPKLGHLIQPGSRFSAPPSVFLSLRAIGRRGPTGLAARVDDEDVGDVGRWGVVGVALLLAIAGVAVVGVDVGRGERRREASKGTHPGLWPLAFCS